MLNKRSIKVKNIVTTLLVIVILYFSFYFLFGRYGFINYTQTKREKFVKEETLKEITAENITIQSKINTHVEEMNELLEISMEESVGLTLRSFQRLAFSKLSP